MLLKKRINQDTHPKSICTKYKSVTLAVLTLFIQVFGDLTSNVY